MPAVHDAWGSLVVLFNGSKWVKSPRSPGQKPWFWHQNCRGSSWIHSDTHGSSSVNDLEKRSPDQILTYGCFPSLTYRPIDSHRPSTLSHPAACNRPSWKSVAHSSSKWKSQMRKRSLHQKRVDIFGVFGGDSNPNPTRMQQMNLKVLVTFGNCPISGSLDITL